MSEYTTSYQAPASKEEPQYRDWREAALGHNLLSYAWENRPSRLDLVPGAQESDPWWLKGLDYASLPARLAVAPLQAAGAATERALASPNLLQDPHAQHQLTEALIDFGLSYGMPGRGLPSFPAWHGSRHEFAPAPEAPFGKFREDKMSTGEGGQAYAWGHYLGGSRKTAESYKTAGGRDESPIVTYDGKQFPIDIPGTLWDHPDFTSDAGHALWSYISHSGDMSKTLLDLEGRAKISRAEADRHLNQSLADMPLREAAAKASIMNAEEYEAGIKWLHEHGHKLGFREPGNLYQVWIKPEHEDLLNWDEILHHQSPKVQEILEREFPQMANAAGAGGPPDYLGMKGGEMYHYISGSYSGYGGNLLGPQGAAEKLDAAGIPGVRFLDQFSRRQPKVINLDDKLWTPDNEIERFAKSLIESGPIAVSRMRHDSLQTSILGAQNRLGMDIVKGIFRESSMFQPKFIDDSGVFRYLTAPEHQARSQATLKWLQDNEDRLRMGDHPDSTYNYVIFHHRHMNIIDRNGQTYGLTPVDHDPFAK